MQENEKDSFVAELEKTAKSLSIGNAKSSVELRRLFAELQAADHPKIEAFLPGPEEKPA